MTKQEKKYRVDSFEVVNKYLVEKGLAAVKESTTTHFYGQQAGTNVTKLVVYSDKQEIHILEEDNGIFSLKDTIPVDSITEGLDWLKSHDFKQVDIIKMYSQTFEYKAGLVRLYLLDDWFHSIILSHAGEELKKVEKELGLTDDDVIVEPYNVYLASLGKLKSETL